MVCSIAFLPRNLCQFLLQAWCLVLLMLLSNTCAPVVGKTVPTNHAHPPFQLITYIFDTLQDIFMATVGILSALVRSDAGALQVARSAPSAIKLWEGICQLLNRKMDMERRYIERLEGESACAGFIVVIYGGVVCWRLCRCSQWACAACSVVVGGGGGGVMCWRSGDAANGHALPPVLLLVVWWWCYVLEIGCRSSRGLWRVRHWGMLLVAAALAGEKTCACCTSPVLTSPPGSCVVCAAALVSFALLHLHLTTAGQKGSDVTAREATRKMVSAATQLDALEKVAARVDSIAAANGVEVQHMQRPHQLPAAGAAAGKAGAADAAEHQEQEGLVPRSASAVVQPNLWQPKNTIVRGAFKESVATRTGMLAAAAAAAGVPLGQSMAGVNAAAAGMSAGGGVSMAGAAAAAVPGMVGKADMFGSGAAAAAAAGVGGGDAAARRLVGPDVLLAAMQQQQQMLTQSADQECRIDQSHKQHRGR
jgi:hypothetical protein